MWAPRPLLAHVAVLALCILEAESILGGCPTLPKSPYIEQASPFGWPLSPNNWTFAEQRDWHDRFLACAGERQSPVNVLTTGPCVHNGGQDGELEGRAMYTVAGGTPQVTVSPYMRSVMLEADFGSIMLQDDTGRDVEYTAHQIHLSADSWHTLNGAPAAAELLILHKPKEASDMIKGGVIVSVMFEHDDAADSPLFEHLGMAKEGPEMEALGSWQLPHYVNLLDNLQEVLKGATYQYEGSVPVPPCTENIKYLVMGQALKVSPLQTAKLKDVLQCLAGGYKKRSPMPNGPGMCRDITKNSLKVKPGHHSAATCQAAWRNETWYRLADCWDSQMTGEEKAICSKSPINLVPETAGSTEGGSLTFNMAPVKSVTVTPSNYTLDALPNVFAVPGAITNFGSMVVNGRSFLMHKISVKPISSHKYNGKHYAAELQVEGIMDGDGFNKLAELSGVHAGADGGHSAGGESHGSNAGHSAGGHSSGDSHDSHDSGSHSSGNHDAGHSGGHSTDGSFSTDIGHGTVDHHDDHDAGAHDAHGGHRRLQAAVEVFHRVILSVPIEIGTENSLLRELGLPFDAYKDSISAMHPYQIENTVNLRSALSKALDGPWMWYRGGMVTPGCPDWGVRWLMLQTPLQASFLQLNFLDMKVSGMDSTRVFPVEMDDATYKATVFKQSLPMLAVDKHSTCDEHEEWNYDNPSCWAQKHPICAQGALQSPIHIERSTVTTQGKDNFLNKCSWRPVTGLHVVNFGKGLAIPTNQIGYITLTGEDGFPDFFEVVQLQLHMPSEHMIDGKSFAAELQVVHRHQATVTQGVNSAESFPFVTASFMFQMSEKDSPLLKQFFLPGVLEPNTFRENEVAVDLMRSLGPALDGDFYSYMGSSTTPDCFQQNKWSSTCPWSSGQPSRLCFRAPAITGPSSRFGATTSRRTHSRTGVSRSSSISSWADTRGETGSSLGSSSSSSPSWPPCS